MDTRANYTAVGAYVIVFTILLIVVGVWLFSKHDAIQYRYYALYTKESVAGLSAQSAVRFNGVPVGYVDNISIDPNDPQRVLLLLAIDNKTPVTTKTLGMLRSQGITGVTYVSLQASAPGGERLQKHNGQRYPVIQSKPSVMLELNQAVRQVAGSIQRITKQFDRVLNNKNTAALTNTVDNLEKFSGVLANNAHELNQTLQDSHQFMKNMSQFSQEMPAVMHEVKTSMVKINKLTDDLSKTSSSARQAFNEGNRTMRGLNQATLPNAAQLFERLDKIANNLQQVSMELEQNPSVLVRGREQARSPGPGE